LSKIMRIPTYREYDCKGNLLYEEVTERRLTPEEKEALLLIGYLACKQAGEIGSKSVAS